MLTVKEPARYQKPAEVPKMPFDSAIEKLCKQPQRVDYEPQLEKQRAMLMAERDRYYGANATRGAP